MLAMTPELTGSLVDLYLGRSRSFPVRCDSSSTTRWRSSSAHWILPSL